MVGRQTDRQTDNMPARIKVHLLNARSVNKKIIIIQDLIVDKSRC